MRCTRHTIFIKGLWGTPYLWSVTSANYWWYPISVLCVVFLKSIDKPSAVQQTNWQATALARYASLCIFQRKCVPLVPGTFYLQSPGSSLNSHAYNHTISREGRCYSLGVCLPHCIFQDSGSVKLLLACTLYSVCEPCYFKVYWMNYMSQAFSYGLWVCLFCDFWDTSPGSIFGGHH